VGTRAKQAEDENDNGEEEKTAYLATAFGLPASC
jgi:hypothetical protein